MIRNAMDAFDQRAQNRLIRWNTRNRIAVQQSQEGLSAAIDDKTVLTRLGERLARDGIVD